MTSLFDKDQILRNRQRAFRIADPGAGFLLDIVAKELAERLSVVERRFEMAAEMNGMDGRVARSCVETGRIEQMDQAEISAHGSETAADFDHLGLAEQKYNLILAPLWLQLANDLPGALIQIRRALKPDGLFLAALAGAGTLGELRDVLLATEAEMSGGASPRVIPFADVRDMGSLLQRAGFSLPVVDVEDYTVRYDNLFGLMRDLRAMGMTNPMLDRSRIPLTRRFFMRAAELYAERFSDPDGRIRASFSIIYVSGWSPHESQAKPLKPGSAKIRLADALKNVLPS
ncbi:SAM-dependent methyltransferase [Allorhizobium sp. BGMRC 0089]|uniref:methyltransferase domain-containing protein n=1 Tax=Allorhizobium sonneratiae TaxID=2934936 RepID=UPI002034230D|nr:methyltransferase domain-containing protein [Allorhizobium sonneratiae]MCM2293515.1 SAM-dependent methyltransferase [Allorhizobium sonneratiae]